jgi:hypothetical protein
MENLTDIFVIQAPADPCNRSCVSPTMSDERLKIATEHGWTVWRFRYAFDAETGHYSAVRADVLLLKGRPPQ